MFPRSIPREERPPHWNPDAVAERLAVVANLPSTPTYQYQLPKRKSKELKKRKYYWCQDSPESEPYKVYWGHWTRPRFIQHRYALRLTPARELFIDRHALDFDPRYEAGPTGPRLKKTRKNTRSSRNEEMLIPSSETQGLMARSRAPRVSRAQDGDTERQRVVQTRELSKLFASGPDKGQAARQGDVVQTLLSSSSPSSSSTLRSDPTGVDDSEQREVIQPVTTSSAPANRHYPDGEDHDV